MHTARAAASRMAPAAWRRDCPAPAAAPVNLLFWSPTRVIVMIPLTYSGSVPVSSLSAQVLQQGRQARHAACPAISAGRPGPKTCDQSLLERPPPHMLCSSLKLVLVSAQVSGNVPCAAQRAARIVLHDPTHSMQQRATLPEPVQPGLTVKRFRASWRSSSWLKAGPMDHESGITCPVS